MSDTAKMRIVQEKPDRFKVEERGFLWMWWNAAYQTVGFGDLLQVRFKTESEAKSWIDNELRERVERDERAAFKKKIVWPK